MFVVPDIVPLDPHSVPSYVAPDDVAVRVLPLWVKVAVYGGGTTLFPQLFVVPVIVMHQVPCVIAIGAVVQVCPPSPPPPLHADSEAASATAILHDVDLVTGHPP